MNKVEKFKMATKSALISAVVVPAMGVVVHFLPTDVFMLNDASLSERFECAYKWKPKNKTYMSYEYREPGTYQYVEEEETGIRRYYDSYEGLVYDESWIEPGYPYDKLCMEEKYAAHPVLTYSLYLGVAGLAYARMRRRKQDMLNKETTKTR